MATQTEIAAHLDLTVVSVRKLTNQGVIPRLDDGAYDLTASRVAYVRHLRAIASGHQSAGGKLNLAEERAKLAIQQTQKLELENAERRGELIRRDDYLASAGLVMSTIRQRILSVATKLQHPLAAESDARECRKIVEAGCREALEELGRLVVQVAPSDSDGDDPG